MQLDRVSIALRNRDAWEAIDLGTTMVRSWWRPVYLAWFSVVLPVAVIANLIFAGSPWLALLVIWWFKPLYDRAVLSVLAPAVFGAAPGAREMLAGLRGLVRSSGLLAALTVRRVDILRSFNLPVRQLEGQSGKAARERERVLGRRAAGHASGLMYVCLMFELTMVLSLSAAVDLVTPAALESEYGLQAFFRDLWRDDQPAWAGILNNVFFVMAISCIEPLYVASGFALYLNRRTTLEAWDLELSFRRSAAATPRGHARKALLVTAMTLALAAVAVPRDAVASASSQEIIREVLAAPEFREHRTETVWQRREPDTQSRSGGGSLDLAEFLKSLATGLAELARYAAYALIAFGAIIVLRFLTRELGKRWSHPAANDATRPPPEVMFGLDVRPESLPADLARTAGMAARSDPRLALSLLYRGALVTLIHRDRLQVADGDTEGDCVRRVARSGPQTLSAYFTRLVNAWTQTAYGRRTVDPVTIEGLCAEWPQHFASSP